MNLTPARIAELVSEAETNEAAFEARCKSARAKLLNRIEELRQEARDAREQARSLDALADKLFRGAQSEDWLACRGVLSSEDIEVFACVSPAGLLDAEEY